jgi:threonine aldolase
MYFASDNCGPALPEIVQAITDANTCFMPSYGNDLLMEEVKTRIRDLFEAQDAVVYLVATGTAANALALATITQPWQAIFCAPLAHIQCDECHAPEFFTGGAKLRLVGEADKIGPEALNHEISVLGHGNVHVSQHGPLALSQVTEMGHVYSLEELRALTSVAKQHGMTTYMDGARFANAAVSLGCTPAEMSWKAGVDVVSFGGTKNGCIGVEAVIFFDPAKAWEFELRRKRGAHLFSKHRFLSAQMLAYLLDDLWHKSATRANAACARLAAGLRDVPAMVFKNDPQANMIFATLPRATHQRLHEAGAVYFMEGALTGHDANAPLPLRLVCDWSVSDAQIDEFIEIAKM